MMIKVSVIAAGLAEEEEADPLICTHPTCRNQRVYDLTATEHQVLPTTGVYWTFKSRMFEIVAPFKPQKSAVPFDTVYQKPGQNLHTLRRQK